MTLPSSTPINVVWRVTPSSHDAAVARPPYDSAISRGTTRVRLGVLRSSPPTGRPKENTPAEHPTTPRSRIPNTSVSQPANRSRDVMCLSLEPDVVSSDSTNSVREQLRQVNQRLDEVQKDFVRSKEEVGETTKGGSSFTPEILDKPIPSSFRLSTLEPYDGSTEPTEHVAAFRAQMALYDTFDALMCHTFPTTLRGLARMWYSRIKLSSISSFDQFTKEFELNFIASSSLRPTAASLLNLAQGNDEPLAQFISRFSAEIQRMPDTHLTLAIQAFLMGLRPSRFFWSLIERPPSMMPEMLQWASQYVAVESLGDSSSTKKAYAWSAVEKRPRSSQDPEITFGDGDDAYPDHDDVLVISARIDNTRVKRIMVDTGRFTGDSISPAGIVVLPVTVGEEPRSKILLVSFIVVALPSADNAIIGKPTLNKLRAVVSTYHRIMKFPTRDGVEV
ncbi:hypothetical protein B296_00017911 [Ensete ventricosum]|uniref:Retrotransposon gag domain-containing protein n=1 Tax=Ensete ventricosum TaxID=4639 RepID=A0A426ZTP7_ENSVE|nr:hypothetical protein B296_00017911 [Ensete ventricosum]